MLRVGIIGCGMIGKKRARVIKEDQASCLCCAADVVIQNAAALKEYADGKFVTYSDWKELLNKEALDVVITATPNKYLKKITSMAAQKNIHILCEKPLGRNAFESERMVEASKDNSVILKTGFNHRHHPAIFRAHQLVKGGTIGEVYFARCIYGHGGRPGYEKEWRASKDICGGGELLDQGVHVVDLFRWFIGDFEEVFGHIPTYYWNMEVEDNAFGFFKTSNGKIASMHTSWTQWKNRFTFEIYGEAGYLIVDGLGGNYGVERLTVGRRQKAEGRSQEKGKGFSGSSFTRLTDQRLTNNSATHYAGGAPEEEITTFDGKDISWREEWREFISAVKEKREPLGNGEDGLEANRMIEAVYASALKNQPVKIGSENT